MRTRIFCLAPAMVDVYVRTYHLQTTPVYACVHTYTYTWNSTYACVHVYTYTCNISPRVEKRCETILRDRLIRESRTRLAYTVNARARTRLSACACAGYAYSYAPAQMTERTYIRTYTRTYIRTYIPRIDPDLYCLALMRSAINFWRYL